MAKFYILDHGVYTASDWTEYKVEVEARSEEAAAADFAGSVDENCVNGQQFEIVVASKADGSDARLYKGRCEIRVSYNVTGSKSFVVLPPDADDDTSDANEEE